VYLYFKACLRQVYLGFSQPLSWSGVFRIRKEGRFDGRYVSKREVRLGCGISMPVCFGTYIYVLKYIDCFLIVLFKNSVFSDEFGFR
jgi:hypothetical protein